MNENDKKGFLFLYEWMETTSELTDEQLGQLVRALFSYDLKKETTTPKDPIVKMAFSFIKSALDRFNDNYLKKSDAGKKGGAPKGNKNASKKTTKNKQKQAENNQKQLTYINTEIETEKEKEIKSNPLSGEGDTPAPAREGFSPFEIFGKFKNVQLFADQYRTLCMTYGQDATDNTIEDLSSKLADGSKQSSNHYATLDYWLRLHQSGGYDVPMSSKTETNEEFIIRVAWEAMTAKEKQDYLDTHNGQTLIQTKGQP